jgi:hypothetical protein
MDEQTRLELSAGISQNRVRLPTLAVSIFIQAQFEFNKLLFEAVRTIRLTAGEIPE